MEVAFPAISPDGTRVAFANTRGDIRVVSMDGTSSQTIVEKHAFAANWSPDGNRLVITAWNPNRAGRNDSNKIQIFDFHTGRLSVVPSSEGIGGGVWPTGKTLIASRQDTGRLLVFDFGKHKSWS